MIRSTIMLLILTVALIARAVEEPSEFEKEKAAHKTVLWRKDKVPEDYKNFLPPPGVKVVLYKSGELNLRAWYRAPAEASVDKRVPALVYFHGGFSLSPADLALSQPFVDAGFAVLAPTLRGENGNPGTFELFLGEADDGLAALQWLGAQPEVDKTRLYAFGHSAGGAISALLSLYRAPGLRLTGSNGGVYTLEILEGIRKANLQAVPFDLKDAREVRLRLLSQNTERMLRTHAAILGRHDAPLLKAGRDIQRVVNENKAPLKFALVDGDGTGAQEPAVKLFIELMRKDLEQP